MDEKQVAITLGTVVMGWDEKSAEFMFPVWNPVKSIHDAWQVVQKLREKGILISVETLISQYKATVDGTNGFFAETAQEAICKAALKAIA